MTRVLAYFALGFVFILAQTAVVPQILPFHLKPDLLLVLIVYLGLNETYVRGGLLAYILGCLVDVYAGRYLGLHGLALLMTFLVVRGAAGRLNTESSVLLLFLVACGTALQGAILFLSLGFFADGGPPLLLFLGQLLPQALLNLAAALLLLQLTPKLQKLLAPRKDIPGLKHLNNRYGS